jgi:hypothetical protein
MWSKYFLQQSLGVTFCAPPIDHFTETASIRKVVTDAASVVVRNRIITGRPVNGARLYPPRGVYSTDPDRFRFLKTTSVLSVLPALSQISTVSLSFSVIAVSLDVTFNQKVSFGDEPRGRSTC